MSRHHPKAWRALKELVCGLLCGGLLWGMPLQSASAQCPPLFSSPPRGPARVPQTTYGFDTGLAPQALFSSTEKDKIRSGINNWVANNTANHLPPGGNCSGVTFGETTYLDANVGITADLGMLSGDRAHWAASFNATFAQGDDLVSATVTFWWGATRSNGARTWERQATDAGQFTKKVALHEFGHVMGLDHVTAPQAGQSVTNPYVGTNDRSGWLPTQVTTCDNQTVNSNLKYRCPTGGGTPPSDDPPLGCYDRNYNGTCPSGTTFMSTDTGGWCCYPSPILVDVEGDGFSMTDALGGVLFDIGNSGLAELISWTTADSDDAWLALDRDGNGSIDRGAELFGNATPQPVADDANGFLALAEYDDAENGGNADGVIDARDAVFPSLRLWRDTNHNGYSEATELSPCAAVGVVRFDLDYRESGRTDQHGNRFRYRAKVYDSGGQQLGRWAWDVYLLTSTSSQAKLGEGRGSQGRERVEGRARLPAAGRLSRR